MSSRMYYAVVDGRWQMARKMLANEVVELLKNWLSRDSEHIVAAVEDAVWAFEMLNMCNYSPSGLVDYSLDGAPAVAESIRSMRPGFAVVEDSSVVVAPTTCCLGHCMPVNRSMQFAHILFGTHGNLVTYIIDTVVSMTAENSNESNSDTNSDTNSDVYVSANASPCSDMMGESCADNRSMERSVGPAVYKYMLLVSRLAFENITGKKVKKSPAPNTVPLIAA